MTDYKHLVQQRIKTLEQNAVFAQWDSDGRRVEIGHTSVIFVNLGVKVDVTYNYDSCCLSYVMSLASLYFRKQCPTI